MQLIVLGMHRSGTSVVARLLNMMGVYFGTEDSGMLPQPDNPKGFWERNDVVALNNRLLVQEGASWRNVLPFRWDQVDAASKDEFRARASEILFRLEPQRPWFIKDPRLSLTLPFWQPLFELPIYIIVDRNPIEIAHSLENREGMPLGAGLALWHRYMIDALNFTRDGQRIFVSYAEIMSDPVKTTRHLAEQLQNLGVPLFHHPSDQEITGFVDPKLYRARGASGELEARGLLTDAQMSTWRILQPSYSGDRRSIIDVNDSNEALYNFLPLEVAHAERTRADLLERENVNLRKWLWEEKKKAEWLFSELKTAEAKIPKIEPGKPLLRAGDSVLENDPVSSLALSTARWYGSKTSDIPKDTDKRLFLLAGMVKRVEDELKERICALQEKAAEATDTFNILAPGLTSAVRRKEGFQDEQFEIYRLKDRLLKKERTIRMLMAWAEALMKTIPLNSAARKAQRYYRHWRSRYKESSLKPLPSPISKLKQDAEIRDRKAWENLNRTELAENNLRKILTDIEHENLFEGLDLSKIYALTGVEIPLIASKSIDDRKLRLRDFSHGIDPLVSIVIPVHNQIGYTFGCLRSLSEIREATPFEVIVVDDCSEEENYQRVNSISGIQVLRNDVNLGFVGSCNKGAAAARGKYTLFLNNDVKVLPGWLDSLVRVFETHPTAGLVGSKLLYPDGTLQEAGGIIWKDGSGCNYGRNEDADKPEYSFFRETDYCSGACIILPSNLLREVGYFDTRYSPAYYEDTDLAFKVRAAGRRVYYQPASEIVHFEGKSNGTDETTGVKKYQVVNAEKFVEKWRTVLQKEHFPNGENLFFAREGSRQRPLMIVIDHYVPTPDHDAGSRSTVHYIKMFLDMGMKVKFIPDNFRASQPYTRDLEYLGVEVLHGSWYQTNIRQWLLDHHQDIQFVFSNRSHITARYLDTLRQMPETKFLYYGHDLGSVRNRRRFELTGNPEDAKKAESEEKIEADIWQQAHAIYYPSAEETRVVLSRFPQANARTLPLYILEPKTLDYENNLPNRHDLIFVGGFAHPPNEDAVLWFLDHCWPQIEKALPDVRFCIIGSHPTTQIENRASKRVIVTGWITDAELDTHYQEARMAVIPLRYGAGVKGKVVEAMHNHVPIVMTPIAAEGLPDVADFTIVQDDPNIFAQNIIDLYQDQDRLIRMGNAGGKYIADHFSTAAAQSVISLEVALP